MMFWLISIFRVYHSPSRIATYRQGLCDCKVLRISDLCESGKNLRWETETRCGFLGVDYPRWRMRMVPVEMTVKALATSGA